VRPYKVKTTLDGWYFGRRRNKNGSFVIVANTLL
jgi:hypothetical protein